MFMKKLFKITPIVIILIIQLFTKVSVGQSQFIEPIKNTLIPNALPIFNTLLLHVQKGVIEQGEQLLYAGLNMQVNWTSASRNLKKADFWFMGYAFTPKCVVRKSAKTMEFDITMLFNDRTWSCPDDQGLSPVKRPFSLNNPAVGKVVINVVTGEIKMNLSNFVPYIFAGTAGTANKMFIGKVGNFDLLTLTFVETESYVHDTTISN